MLMELGKNFLIIKPGWFRVSIGPFSFYAKNHTKPGMGLLFSQRNGYIGKVVGKYYFSFTTRY